MIRAAALIALIALAGCVEPAVDQSPETPVVDEVALIYTALTPELSIGLRQAKGRFDNLDAGQIDQLMFSVLRTVGCRISNVPEELAAQYSVFGFSAYRSVRLPVADYEAWASEDPRNAAIWSDHKNSVGRKLQQRAGRSGAQSTFFTDEPGGVVIGLSDCAPSSGT